MRETLAPIGITTAIRPVTISPSVGLNLEVKSFNPIPTPQFYADTFKPDASILSAPKYEVIKAPILDHKVDAVFNLSSDTTTIWQAPQVQESPVKEPEVKMFWGSSQAINPKGKERIVKLPEIKDDQVNLDKKVVGEFFDTEQRVIWSKKQAEAEAEQAGKTAEALQTESQNILAQQVKAVIDQELTQTIKTYEALEKAGIPQDQREEIITQALEEKMEKQTAAKNKTPEKKKEQQTLLREKIVERIELIYQKDEETNINRQEAGEKAMGDEEEVSLEAVANALPQTPKLKSKIVKENHQKKDGSLEAIKKFLKEFGRVTKEEAVRYLKIAIIYFTAVKVEERLVTKAVTDEDVERVKS